MINEANQKAQMAQGLDAAYFERRRNEPRVLVIEQLEGGFIVAEQHPGYARRIAPNIDALIGAVNRWHRDGQRPEHD